MRAKAQPPRAPCVLAALLCALLAAELAACGQPVVVVDLAIVTRACDGPLADSTRNPVAGVDTLRFKISGDGLSTSSQTARFSDNSFRVPNLALGTNRRISVEALKGNLIWARADSGKFDLLDGRDLQLTLILRVVDTFTLTSAAAGSACTKMTTPRAGHAMTALPDGRVLITGGFTLDSSSLVHYLKDAELYDPGTGAFTPLLAAPSYRRAGHAALAVSLGTSGTGVLLAGGESDSQTGVGPVRPFELFTNGAWQPIPPAQPLLPAREHQAAVVDLKTGFAVLAGGLDGPDTTAVPTATVLASVSYYDPQRNAVVDVEEPLAVPLFDAVAVSRANLAPGGGAQGGFVLVGGRDAHGDASAQISGMTFVPTYNAYHADQAWERPSPWKLPAPRVRHFAARLQDDSIVVVGGVTKTESDTYANPTDAVTVINPAATPSVADVVTPSGGSARLSQARADGCGALLETGQVLYAGGAWKDAAGVHSARVADVVTITSGNGAADEPVRTLRGPAAGNTWGLQEPRHRAACLRLKDGSVLVTGGLKYAADGSGGQVTLDSAEIYMPAAAQ